MNNNTNPAVNPQPAEAAAPKMGLFKKVVTNKRFRMGSFATILTAVFIAVVLVLNLVVTNLTDRFGFKLDLTAEGLYGLSDDTIDYLKGIDQDISLTVLSSEKDMSGINDYFLQAVEIIKKFPATSPHISLRFVDFVSDPTVAAQFPELSLNARDVIVQSGDRTFQVSASSMFNVSSEGYITGSVADQAITSAIMNVLSDYIPKVTLLTAGSSSTFDASALQALLTNNAFEVAGQDLLLEEIDQAAEVAILIAPTQDLDEEILSKLDAYLDNGGQKGRHLIYFASSDQPALPNLETFLAEWGIGVGDGVVFETNANRMYSSSPYISIVDYAETELSGRLTSTSVYAAMPFSRPLSALFEASNSRTVEVYLSFAKTSGVMPSDAGEEFDAADAVYDTYPALLRSTMVKTVDTEWYESSVTACSSAYGLSSSFLNTSTFSNGRYLVNYLNDLLNREITFTVTAKVISDDAISLTANQVLTYGAIFVIVLPLAILITGIVVWLKRRNK